MTTTACPDSTEPCRHHREDENDSGGGGVVDFVTALREKYSDCDTRNSSTPFGGEEFQIIVSRPRRNGDQDDSDFRVPSLVSLNNFYITSAGDVSQLGTQREDVTELDVANNRISDWNDVYQLMKSFPNLRLLNLSYNPLCRVSEADPPCTDKLKSLVLNSTRAPYQMVERLVNACPMLEELHLSLNDYETVDLDPSIVHDKLRILYFNSNNVTDWTHIVKFGEKFPRLENLTISNSQLEELGEGEVFKELKSLCLSRSGLRSFDELEKLNSFPALDEVRLRDTPIIDDYEEKLARQLLLAHLPRVTRLNASAVSDLEREDAERAAIRYYMELDEQPERYDILVSKHGKLDPLVDVDFKPENFVTVRVKHDTRVTLMKIDVRWTVRQVKVKIGQWAKLAPRHFKLYYNDPVIIAGPTVCCIYPNRFLHSMRVSDGCEFEIMHAIQPTVKFPEKSK